MSFNNKVVLVTGGSSGIGAAAAVKFSKKGAQVVIVGRDVSKLQNTVMKCQEYEHQPFIISADLLVKEEMKHVIEKTIEQFGKLDVLVNNAGVCGWESILSDKALEVFEFMMNINLKTVVYLTHFAAPHLVKTKGCIVNISSVGSTAPMGNGSFAYCTSKVAVDHFTRCVALELSAKSVRVNSINPGPVRTDCFNKIIPDVNEQQKQWDFLTSQTALGKLSAPEEIADLILYLASDKAKSITGSSFVIDNGMLLKSYDEIIRKCHE